MFWYLFFYTRCFCAPNLRAWVAHSFKHSPLSVLAGERILILVRQADLHFTPRVWLVPIVHCQGLLMERQQWIPSPHKWLSDRAPSSITSYNVEVQKMRPLGGLIWCFICSFETLFNPPPPSQQQLYVPVHALGCKQSKSAQNCGCSSARPWPFLIRWTQNSSSWPRCRQWSNNFCSPLETAAVHV